MNKVMTSVVALGAGMAAYNLMKKNNMISGRQMRKMQKRVKRSIF